MIWLILEAVLSVVLFLLIIWWTMPRKRDQERDKKD
jgi:phage shock protein PspC (stress-responsive transcriptional regulator)